VTDRRVAVADLGSNSFRLVVFTASEHGWWKKTDEVYETVRVGEGLGKSGRLKPAAVERALRTIELFAAFADHADVDEVHAVATSAIRDAENAEEVVGRSALPIRVISDEEEATYGYVGAVNSTTLTDGAVLDIGGGSLQLVEVAGREADDRRSWPLGSVRMTERFLPGGKASKKGLRALREHVRDSVVDATWLIGAGGRGQLVGIGGSVRNLASAAAARGGLALPTVQGFCLGRAELADLVDELADRSVKERGELRGIKVGRADVILAAAVAVHEVMEVAGFEHLEATEWGLREGVFLARAHGTEGGGSGLAPTHLLDDVRGTAVRNLAAQYQDDLTHAEHVTRLALGLWDELAAAGVHPGDPNERELLAAAALLHDVGMAVDYDDHHKHGRYLVLSAGLPGFSPRELVLIAQAVRYHRKGDPDPGEFAPLLRTGDEERLARLAAVLRVVEQLERARSQLVHGVRVEVADERVTLVLEGEADMSVPVWGARAQAPLFRRAFGRELVV